MLAYIFSAQGWGSLFGSIIAIIVLACYKKTMDTDGHTHKVDGGACLFSLNHLFFYPSILLHPSIYRLAITDTWCNNSICDSVWRIIVELSLVPALGTLYFRLTLPEAKKYTKSQEDHSHGHDADESTAKKEGMSNGDGDGNEIETGSTYRFSRIARTHRGG